MKIIINGLLEMSMTASVVIMAVLLARLFMRRCPKIYSYLLWVIVGIRLCIPVSFESRLSIFNLFAKAETEIKTTVSVPTADTAVQTAYDPYKIIGIVWLTGMLALTVYGIFTYYRLQHKLRVSFPMGDSVYGVESLSSPFVMGFTSPKIYIPLGLDRDTENYVLMHERTHLKRGDHLIKLFAFGLLCIHWFNPFCWLAFIFMSRDMEMSCDERVLGTGDISTEYSSALLSFSANKRFPSPGPLCFGEVSVKRRIKNILSWKKPALYITVISLLLCVSVFAVCGTDPTDNNDGNISEGGVETARKTSDTSAEDTTLADITSADTTAAETTTADTAAVDTTTVDTTTVPLVTTAPPVTTAVTTQSQATSDNTYYYPKETQTSSIITPEMEASFAQSLKEHEEYIRESMRKDMEEWYEKNTTAKSTSDQNKNSNNWSIIIFPQPGQRPGVGYP